MTQDARQTRVIYEIQILGELAPSWQPYFSDLVITPAEVGRVPSTTLSGPVVDQPALRGLLCKLWDLNLTLLSVRRVEED